MNPETQLLAEYGASFSDNGRSAWPYWSRTYCIAGQEITYRYRAQGVDSITKGEFEARCDRLTTRLRHILKDRETLESK